MNCGMKIVKYMLFGFNLIFFVFALVLIGVGAAVEIKYRSIVQLTGSAISAAPVLLICIGVFILFVAFFGCCGAFKENYCMVTTFSVLMGIIFVLEIAAVITAYVLRGRIDQLLLNSFDKSITEYTSTTAPAFNFIQHQFKCCGSVSPENWNSSTAFQAEARERITNSNITNPAAQPVPDSCCVVKTLNCGLTAETLINTNGCVSTIEALFRANIVIVGAVGLAIMFIQLVGLLFSCLLMRTIKEQYEVV